MLSEDTILKVYNDTAGGGFQTQESILAGLRAVAEAAVKDAAGGEAVAILNCGEIGPTGEQDEFEIDCEYGALERFTSQHPGKKFKLYTRPQASAAVPDGMVLVPVKATAEMSYAADRAMMERGYIRGGGADRVWAAMLAASQPEVQS